MKSRHLLVIILLLPLLSGCDMIKTSFSAKNKTKVFIDHLLVSDYKRAIEQLAMNHESAKGVTEEQIKPGLDELRKGITDNFEYHRLNYTFLSAEKTAENKSTNTTTTFIEIDDGKTVGVLQVTFDDTSGKILNVLLKDSLQQKPSTFTFWLFGLAALTVPAFNIYVTVRIARSNLKRKWAKYPAVILLNVPTITYHIIDGLTFSLLSFQILFGISFASLGNTSSYWAFGIPLGGLYWFFKLRNRKEQKPEPVAPSIDLLDDSATH